MEMEYGFESYSLQTAAIGAVQCWAKRSLLLEVQAGAKKRKENCMKIGSPDGFEIVHWLERFSVIS